MLSWPAEEIDSHTRTGLAGHCGVAGDGAVEQLVGQGASGRMQASGDSLKAMLPMHRQMAANLLAQMNREMRQMNMPADPVWTATVDSVRQDLVRLPEMGASELQSAMPAHESRLGRLMQMHQSMMGGPAH